MAPGPGGGVYVSIPRPGGSVLALLDGSGRPRPGWPIKVSDSTSCGLLLPLDDGSVRVVCDATDTLQPERADVRAFAFDASGRSMAGWPVQLGPAVGEGPSPPGYAGRVVGDQLTLFVNRFASSVTTIAAGGSIRRGTDVPQTCCGIEWDVGPDGIAYGVDSVSGLAGSSAEVSRITALDPDGVRAGWPVKFDGIASGPAFGPNGRIVVSVGSFVRDTSRLLVFDRDGKAVSARSAQLPITTAEGGVDCTVAAPKPPIVAQDGTIFVFSEIDTAVFALAPSLEVMRGWPYRLATPFDRPDPWRGTEGINCTSIALPAVGPDSTLYLLLQPRSTKVGSSVVAIGPDGRVRPGWPVELKRPGAEFWSVVVGSDGSVYALAMEPETGNRYSATILAIAPDGTVLYRTTIIDP